MPRERSGCAEKDLAERRFFNRGELGGNMAKGKFASEAVLVRFEAKRPRLDTSSWIFK